jgi:hypothetical protein
MGRLQAMHLARRLPYGSFADATYAGLQDTAPRAALLSLHARMAGVGPATWEHPDLVQVWGPRGAVWLVHRDAVAAFTLGRLPRDDAARRRRDALAEDLLAGADGPRFRAAAATGRFLVRWDARTTRILPVEPPDVDVEDARIDLARRFLAWFGEELRPRYAEWAGVGKQDAAETLRRLPPVELPARPAARGVRFLPLFDPYRYGGPQPGPHHAVLGTVLVDGRPAGTWTRQQHRIGITLDDPAHRDRVVTDAERLAQPLGRPVAVVLR